MTSTISVKNSKQGNGSNIALLDMRMHGPIDYLIVHSISGQPTQHVSIVNYEKLLVPEILNVYRR